MTVIQLRTWAGGVVTIDLEQLLVDFLGQALLEATAAYWLRRADTLDAARPAPTDWPGASTAFERCERDCRLTAAAEACRNRATVTLMDLNAS